MSTPQIMVGAGPANLDRILRVINACPPGTPLPSFVLIDKRVNPAGELNRAASRANIFRFPVSVAEELCQQMGISLQEFMTKATRRPFSETEGFQAGDESVFGAEDFVQIQIRDLQQYYLDAIKRKLQPFEPEAPNQKFTILDINADVDTVRRVSSSTEVTLETLTQKDLTELRTQLEKKQLDLAAANDHPIEAAEHQKLVTECTD
jgi:hypothetical protein